MKKIMFNDRYGLTQAVLEGKKTMTRRLMTMTLHKKNGDKMEPIVPDNMFIKDGVAYFCLGNLAHKVPKENQPAYNVGDELAVAQSYKAIGLTFISPPDTQWGCTYEMPGYSNKMFVRADLMPHRIRIINIKVERLQDISEEDAMREGVFKYDKPPLHHEADMFAPWAPNVRPYKWDSDNLIYRYTARYAFAYLIDKISGRGTWQSNPWVYAYTFELTK